MPVARDLMAIVACFVAPIAIGNAVLAVGWYRRRRAARNTIRHTA